MTDVPEAVRRLLALSTADACIVVVRTQSGANVRWAHNTVTTNGAMEELAVSVLSLSGQRLGTVSGTSLAADRLESLVRQSEAAAAHRPAAPDYAPLLEGDGTPADWTAPPAAGADALDRLAPTVGDVVRRARTADVRTFGYAERQTSTVWLATSTGLRRRHETTIGRVAITAKTPDLQRSSWIGQSTADFADVDAARLFSELERRLSWAARRAELPAGHYDVLLEPSCTADLAIAAQRFMIRRDADEGRSPFSGTKGQTRVGERLFGRVSITSDPDEPGLAAEPFHVCTGSDEVASAFDNGLKVPRTEWVHEGILTSLMTPRYWARRSANGGAVPPPGNLTVAGEGPALDEMIGATARGLLVTSFWYIRTVDPQTALLTGLTRDGVFLVEGGEVRGAVNNFRWNMSPVTALAQAVEIGRSERTLPREHDEFPRAKAPPLRIERFHMSSVSEAS